MFTRTGELHIAEGGYIKNIAELKNAMQTGCTYPEDEETKQADGKFYLRCIVETRGGLFCLGTLGFWAVYGEGVDRTNYRNATPLYGVTRRTFEKETGGEV